MDLKKNKKEEKNVKSNSTVFTVTVNLLRSRFKTEPQAEMSSNGKILKFARYSEDYPE